MFMSSGLDGRMLPYQNIALTYNATKINLGPGSQNLSSNSGYITIEYTKAPAGLLAPNPDDMRTIENEEPINEEPTKEEK